jgi:hypothetical protein
VADAPEPCSFQTAEDLISRHNFLKSILLDAPLKRKEIFVIKFQAIDVMGGSNNLSA